MNNILEVNEIETVFNGFYRGANGQLIRSHRHGWYIHNARGDVVARVMDSGTFLHRYLYNAFGNELNPNQNNTNPFRFAGEYWDFETGTYYLRARHFNPRTGRFTQPDPFWNVGNMNGSTWAILQAGNLFIP